MTVSSTPNQDPSRVADQAGPAAHEQAAPRGGSTRTLAYDLVVAGSGGAGLAAAIAGADAGLKVLVIEGAPTWGGLITSRSPEDLPAFSDAIVSQLAGTPKQEEEKS